MSNLSGKLQFTSKVRKKLIFTVSSRKDCRPDKDVNML